MIPFYYTNDFPAKSFNVDLIALIASYKYISTFPTNFNGDVSGTVSVPTQLIIVLAEGRSPPYPSISSNLSTD